MTDLILLNAKTEPAMRWEPPANFGFLRHLALLPIQATEAGRLASMTPIAIVKDASRMSGWSLVAVCGRTSQENVLVGADGQWLGSAIPDSARYIPFAIRDVGAGKALAAIDKRYAKGVMAKDGAGVPLYGEDGKLHPVAQKRVEFLSEHQPRIRRTQAILAALDKAGVIGQWPEAASKAGDIQIEGLHTIDEKALSTLDDGAFLELRKQGALAVAYSCLLSLYQARNFATAVSQAKTGSPTAVQTTGDLDLEFLNDTDIIKFGPQH